MVMKHRIYVETSVISYLTARPSRDLSLAARQQSALALWDAQSRYTLLISDLVLMEAQAGDAQAAAARLACLEGLAILPLDDDAKSLAAELLARRALPEKAYADALHIGIAASHGVEVIASWNFRHIASVWARSRIESALADLGFGACRIATPEELVEGDPS